MRWKLLIPGMALAAGLPVVSAMGELPRGVTRPKPACGVPGYGYSNNAAPRGTVTAVSLVRVPANRLTNTGADPYTPQVYQLKEDRLRVDHCYLSRIAVALHRNGDYEISFRADQNPVPSDDPGSPLKIGEKSPSEELQTGQLLRNQFFVTFRGYANFPTAAETAQRPVLTKPALFELPLTPFWVQRGKPHSGRYSDNSSAVKRNFEYIERIEVEFTYK